MRVPIQRSASTAECRSQRGCMLNLMECECRKAHRHIQHVDCTSCSVLLHPFACKPDSSLQAPLV